MQEIRVKGFNLMPVIFSNKLHFKIVSILIIFISIFTLTGCLEKRMKFLREFGKEGSGAEDFSGPTDVAVNSKGEVFICDTGNNRVVKYSPDFQYMTSYSVANDAKFRQPKGIGIDTKDNVYIADTGNNRVLKFDTNGSLMMEIYSTVKIGQQKDPSNTIKCPYDVCVGPNGIIYIIDLNNRLLVYDQNGLCINKLGSKGTGSKSFDVPTRLAVTNDEGPEKKYYLYVADSFNTRIVKFDNLFNSIYEVRDKGVLNYIKDPRGLTVMPDKTLIASDCGDLPVCVYTNQGVFEGSAGSYGLGRAKIASPGGVAYDAAKKRIIVTDQLQHKILVFAMYR